MEESIHCKDRSYEERFQLCALAGASEAASGVQESFIVYHGAVGCYTMCLHMRTGQTSDGIFVPITSTGLDHHDCIQGAKEKLFKDLRKVTTGDRKPRLIWTFTSCTTSIIGEDIWGISSQVEKESGIDIIPIDTAGFLGGFSSGADMVYAALLDRFVPENSREQKDEMTANLIGPNLMGSKSWPNDLAEIVRLLEAIGIRVNVILTRNTKIDELKEFTKAKTNYALTSEDLPLFERKIAKLEMERWGQDLVLPIGMTNTEEWYYRVAEKLRVNPSLVKNQLEKDMDRVKRILKLNFNATWYMNWCSGKRAVVIGQAIFAASIARYLFYDLNIYPRVIGLFSESKREMEAGKNLLVEMSRYCDFEILENPSYYEYGKKVKEKNVEIAIGSIQDKPLMEGLGVAHRILGGPYFFNNWFFVPWPHFGILGTLNLMTEMAELMNQMSEEKDHWKYYSYIK